MVNLADPRAGYIQNKKSINSKILRTLSSGQYILGENVKAFESDFSNYIGTRHAVSVNSGTDALELCLRALEIGKGDYVLTTAHTALATISAIITVGATPLIVDIDSATFNIDITRAVSSINRRVRAIIAVHIYGKPCEMDELLNISKNFKVPIIEDCAQACGASFKDRKIGSYGLMSAFSFYPTKNLGALGDGGAILTSNKKLADSLYKLRQYGWDNSRKSRKFGRNSRLDDIQAAILIDNLKRLDKDNSRRREIAEFYNREFQSLQDYFSTPSSTGNFTHVYHLYVLNLLSTSDRDKLINFLKSKNIGTGIHYPTPCHLQPGYKDLVRLAKGGLPVTERIAKNIISIPMHPWLKDREIKKVSSSIKEYFSNK